MCGPWTTRAHMKSTALLGTFAFAFLVACRGEAPEVGATPDPQIDSMVNQQAESAAPGSVMVSETLLRGVGYDKGELQDFHVEMTAGQCYVIVGAADETVTSLHLTVWDPANKRVGQDRSKSREALVQHCPKETGSYKIQGKIGRGAGHFAIGVFGKEAPEKAAAAEEPKADKADLEAIINADAESIAPGAKQDGKFYTGTAKKSEFYVQLEKGTCYWFIGAAQPGVDDYYLYLWNQEGKRLTESKADSNKANIGHCAKDSSMYKVQIKVDDDSDEVKLGIFSKKGK
jgi:hypothetical protein